MIRYETLDERMRTLLPPVYQDTYEQVEPVPMGSAGLLFDPQGRVAWDRIWGSFCDLALAGGPPHKGRLLEPEPCDSTGAAGSAYEAVVSEACRGIVLTTGLGAEPSEHPGWLQVDCDEAAAAQWLCRAITVENVSVRLDGQRLLLPAGSSFRLDKEIKNVVTVVAKTHHYWAEHIDRLQRRRIAALLEDLEESSPLVQPRLLPASTGTQAAEAALLDSGLATLTPVQPYENWLGLVCGEVRDAIRKVRMLMAMNVLARREGAVLFLPVDVEADPFGRRVCDAVRSVWPIAARRAS